LSDRGSHRRSAAPAERFEDFAHPGKLRETFQFRSSWLGSSLAALRTRGLLEAYRERLPARYHEPIFAHVAGVWLAIDVAVAHYDSIDRLNIAASTVFEMGLQIQDHAQPILAPLALRAAKGAGVTPWTILAQSRKLWDRTWRGGDFAIDKLGPKEAELVIVGWTIAGSPYVRGAMRGIFHGLLGMFCEKVYVRDLPAKCTRLSLAYRFAWV
jgi:hypothetical protein